MIPRIASLTFYGRSQMPLENDVRSDIARKKECHVEKLLGRKNAGIPMQLNNVHTRVLDEQA